MTKKVTLPCYPTAKSLAKLLACASEILSGPTSEIECDGSRVHFVDPCGLAVFGCVADTAYEAGSSLKLHSFNPEILSYIARMDAFTGFIAEDVELGHRHHREDALLEVTKVTSNSEAEQASTRLVQAIVGKISDFDTCAEPDEMTGMTPQDQLEEPLRYIFTELFDNVFQHARPPVFANACAWVCAQYTPSNDTVRVAFADNGCGFLASLREHPDLAAETDKAAIELALQERKSGNPALQFHGAEHAANQGVGLTVVSRMIAKIHGKMWIATGSAIAEISRGQPEIIDAYWQGSVLALEFRRKKLMEIRPFQIIDELEGAETSAGLNFI